MKLAKAYEPNHYEPDIYAMWEKSGVFDPKGEGEPYSIVMPPPNANGNLHVGHALIVSYQDMLVRYNRMQGKDADEGRRNDPHGAGDEGHRVGGDDLPQGHPVLAGQGHVQGAGGGLVRLDRRAHAPRVGLADRPGQRVGLGGVEPAQRVRPLPQDAGVEVGQFGVLSQHLGQEGGPPAVGQLGVQVVVGDQY